MTIFHRGMKVACTNTDALGMLGYGDEQYPVLNTEYTVRDIVVDNFGFAGLLLKEIRNDRLPYVVNGKTVDFEKCFASWRFRPLVSGERELEIEGMV